MTLNSAEQSNWAAETTLFIHGNLASQTWWGPTLETWKKLGSLGDKSLITLDLRGCGKNPALPTDAIFTLDDLATDVLTLIEERDLKQIALVGHSLGGLVVLKLLSLRPELFTRAVLLDSVGYKGVLFDESMYAAFQLMAKDPAVTRAVILSTIKNASHLSGAFEEQIAAEAFHAVGGFGRSVLEILKTTDLSQDLKRILQPVLLLHGAEDTVIPPKDSQATAERIAHSKLEIIPEAGHCWNVENPEAFTKRLRLWLSS